jgi:UDP-N-acetylmuramyl pentapeptide phosphotransferase/UDP-N-acetylglucosamine-1-phosphate transferase
MTFGPAGMPWLELALMCLAAALAAWALTGIVLQALKRWRVFDMPNPRSSHAAPKPRGAGLALIPVILIAWVAAEVRLGGLPNGHAAVSAGAAVLAVVSWIDDLRHLPATLRLAVHAVAVGLALLAMGNAGPVFQGLMPPLADRLVAGILWLWFVNLFNFMDGIDGISGVEASTVGLGLALVAALAAWPAGSVALPALLAAATLGFLAWNWPPSKLFLGDVGSVPLGYLLGWLLIAAAAKGQWAAALILPLYYLADATITLARRTLRGAAVWRAHREHFYQRAVQGGASHAGVSLGVLACDALLIACALGAALGYVWLGLAGAAVAVGGLLAMLQRRAGAATSE